VQLAGLGFLAPGVDGSARSGSEGLDVETGKVIACLGLGFNVAVEV
jgi:hypothetical protein